MTTLLTPLRYATGESRSSPYRHIQQKLTASSAADIPWTFYRINLKFLSGWIQKPSAVNISLSGKNGTRRRDDKYHVLLVSLLWYTLESGDRCRCDFSRICLNAWARFNLFKFFLNMGKNIFLIFVPGLWPSSILKKKYFFFLLLLWGNDLWSTYSILVKSLINCWEWVGIQPDF